MAGQEPGSASRGDDLWRPAPAGGRGSGGGAAVRGTARVAAWLETLPPRRREWVQDGTVAAALALVNMLSLLPYHAQIHRFWLASFLAAAQCLPLAWRRSWPVLALSVLAVPRVFYDALNLGYAPLPLAPAIGFGTVMDRSSTPRRWLVIIVAVGVITATQAQPGHNEPYDAIVTVLTFAAAGVVGALSRARRAALAAQAHRADVAEAHAGAMAARVAQEAAAERMRIARELHDVVAHHVSLVAVQAEAAASLLPDRPEQAARSVDLISQTARQAMTELRRLLGVLREAGLTGALDPYSERPLLTPSASLSRIDEVLAHVRSAGLPVTFKAWGTPAELSPSVDLTAYRIVQEALTNTMKHAPGATAQVEISYEEEFLTVQVLDSGTSSRASPARAVTVDPEARGFGLAGIAERVYSCGGTLLAGPRDAGGFAVTARLPVR